MKIFFICLLAIFLLISCENHLPGFKLSITQKGLHFITKVATDVLINELSGFELEEQEGETGTPIGDIKWKIKELSVFNLIYLKLQRLMKLISKQIPKSFQINTLRLEGFF
jgi:hypothetical protein